MSEQFGIIRCTLCNREYKKYYAKDLAKIHGIDFGRSGNWNQILVFVAVDKSPVNKHICTQCISDIINEFGE